MKNKHQATCHWSFSNTCHTVEDLRYLVIADWIGFGFDILLYSIVLNFSDLKKNSAR